MALNFIRGSQTATSRPSSGSTGTRFESKSKARTTTSKSNDKIIKNEEIKIGDEDWSAKYCPHSMEDVVVHHTYVKAVREWLLRATRAHAELGSRPGFKPFVLALCGPSGCGKSSLVEALCAELKLQVVEWTDDVWQNQQQSTIGNTRSDYWNRPIRELVRSGDTYDEATDWGAPSNREAELEQFVLSTAYPTLTLAHPKRNTIPSIQLPVFEHENVAHIAKRMRAEPAASAVDPENASEQVPSYLLSRPRSQEQCSKSSLVSESRPFTARHALGSITSKNSAPVEVIVIEDSDSENDHGGESRSAAGSGTAEIALRQKSESICVTIQSLVEGQQTSACPANKGAPAGSESGTLNVDSSDDDSFEPTSTSHNSRRNRAKKPKGRLLSGNPKTKTCSRSEVRGGASGEVDAPSAPMLGKIMLLHDLPHVTDSFSGRNSSNGNSNSLGRMLGMFAHPVVMICSGIEGKDDVQYASRSFLPESARGLVYIETLFQAACTPIAITKALQRICRAEMQQGSTSAAGSMSKEALETIAENSLGDLRHAVLQLQWRVLSETAPHTAVPKAKAQNKLSSTATGAALAEIPNHHHRDKHLSSLHGIAKLANAQLNARGFLSWEDSADTVMACISMDREMVFTMLQSHVLSALEASAKTLAMAPPAAHATEDLALEHIEQASAALSVCSDISMFLGVKYDTNATHDRSAGNAFPDEYTSALTCRFAAVSRGVGAAERTEWAKAHGGKGTFLQVRRPLSLDLRARCASMSVALKALGADLAVSADVRATTSAVAALVPSVAELALNVVPMLSLISAHSHAAICSDSSTAGARREDPISPLIRWRLNELRRLRDCSLSASSFSEAEMLPMAAAPVPSAVTFALNCKSPSVDSANIEDIDDFDD